jgi:5-formyltetrahydrofolate cyclo-ligase
MVLGLAEVTAAAQAAGTVAAYVSRGSEPSTLALLDHLSARGVRVLLPVVRPDRDLDWALDDGTRRPGVVRGVLEPGGPRLGVEAISAADVVLVPALARTRAGAAVVALLHPGELLESVPVAGHDRRVDVAVTSERVVRFGAQ